MNWESACGESPQKAEKQPMEIGEGDIVRSALCRNDFRKFSGGGGCDGCEFLLGEVLDSISTFRLSITRVACVLGVTFLEIS